MRARKWDVRKNEFRWSKGKGRESKLQIEFGGARESN